jgi:hypothetical protein
MPLPHRTLILAAFLALLPLPTAWAQAAPVPAPGSIANSLIQFNSQTDSSNSSELVLFRADGSFQDLQNYFSIYPFTGSPSLAPGNGTYTYKVSPANPTVGIITVTSGNGGIELQSGTQLSFFSATAGGWPGPAATFQLSPGVAPAGAGNVATRGLVSVLHPMDAGFVIEGNESRWVLIRGDGPSLAQFGVTDAVAHPQVTVYSGSQSLGALPVWSADPNLIPGFDAVFSVAGAFPFPSGTSDCVGLFQLRPGAYTAQGTSGGDQGEILLEVYILPFGT